MAIIYTYPKVTAASGDLVVITDVSDSNKTKQVTIESMGAAITKVDSIVTTDGTYIDLTPNAPTSGNVTITADFSATGVPGPTTFLCGNNTWATPIGGGTVTSVGTTNNISGSGISFAAAPNPIIGAGSITLGFSGTIGDILYADTVSTLAKLPAGATPGHVLTTNGAGVAPSWQVVAGYSGWDIDADSNPGAAITISSGGSLDVVGGTVITTKLTAGPTEVTIDHDSVSRTNNTSAASPGFGGSFTAVDSITSSPEGHLTAINTKTVTLPNHPLLPAVKYDNSLALVGCHQANTTTTGAITHWAQGIFTRNVANYTLIGEYCYLEFDLEFAAVAGWAGPIATPTQYMLVNLPFNVNSPPFEEQGFGIVTESKESFSGHTLALTTITTAPPIDITEFQDPKRGDRGVVNYWSAPPAVLIPSSGVLPAWAQAAFDLAKTNYMCFTYPDFFQGDVKLTPLEALRQGVVCRLRGNIIYRVDTTPAIIVPPDENYAGD